MVPGVVIGGQIASSLQGRIKQQRLERIISVLFGFIGLAFAGLVVKGLS